MNKLEIGQCFFISRNEVIVDDNTVFVQANEVLFKVGKIPANELSWFGNQLNKDVVVYIGNDNFSFKKFTSPLEEFETLKYNSLGDMRDTILVTILNEIEEYKIDNKVLQEKMSGLSY